MAVKRYFGADAVLVEIELPDAPLPVPNLKGDQSIHKMLNPTNVDPHTLVVDAASVPDLKPTDGAQGITKFPDRIPGSGEGAGVGQKSGLTLRDAWENNPDRVGTTQVDTVQSGAIGSAVVDGAAFDRDGDGKVGGSKAKTKTKDEDELTKLA